MESTYVIADFPFPDYQKISLLTLSEGLLPDVPILLPRYMLL